MYKLPISAVVGVMGTQPHLADCLESISFCDEIILAILDNNKESIEIGTRYGAKLLDFEAVPVIEKLHYKVYKDLSHPWMLITDPDEVIDNKLAKKIIAMFPQLGPNIAVVRAPIRYYFKKHALVGTPWGGRNSRRLLVHTQRVNFSPTVHSGIHIKKGFGEYAIEATPSEFIHHYWAKGWINLIGRHLRYLREEGRARYTQGEQFGLKCTVRMIRTDFKFSYHDTHGYKDGRLGFLLSLFWALYNFLARISLGLYLRKHHGRNI
jgi:hypothetical protein